MDDSEIDVFRRKSHYFADYAKVAQNEVSTLSRWLTASLLAVNGGGALAAANTAGDTVGLWVPGVMFYGGIAAAFFSAWFNQWITQKFIPSATKLASYYAEAAFLGQRNTEFESNASSEITQLGTLTWIGPASGWLSFVLFSVGVYMMADGIEATRSEKVRLCQSLERDLLSDRASHVESRERFVALNCRSKG